jgi:hypothetical protein
MKTFSTILQGSEAIEKFALEFALQYDFSQDDVEEYSHHFLYDTYVDTVNGIEVYYNSTADYYFFSSENL